MNGPFVKEDYLYQYVYADAACQLSRPNIQLPKPLALIPLCLKTSRYIRPYLLLISIIFQGQCGGPLIGRHIEGLSWETLTKGFQDFGAFLKLG